MEWNHKTHWTPHHHYGERIVCRVVCAARVAAVLIAPLGIKQVALAQTTSYTSSENKWHKHKK